MSTTTPTFVKEVCSLFETLNVPTVYNVQPFSWEVVGKVEGQTLRVIFNTQGVKIRLEGKTLRDFPRYDVNVVRDFLTHQVKSCREFSRLQRLEQSTLRVNETLSVMGIKTPCVSVTGTGKIVVQVDVPPESLQEVLEFLRSKTLVE